MSDKIGRFEILSEIVRTPESCIYKASDPDSGQTVALKTIKLERLGGHAAALVQRILAEADTTKPLNSQNIALLYGAGEIDGCFCASVEYVQGKSIAAMLAGQEAFSTWDLQDIARQACQGLDHAHSHKVVHYTLEPAKVLVSWDGTVKMLGFGISGMGASAAQASGQAPETLHYMSPEQLRGEPLDARSNLFSMGAILYEMVTDRKAFPGEDAEQVRQEIAVGMPVAPAQINSKIHPALSALIMKALSKVPEQRFQSGQDLVNELENCKEGSPKATVGKKAPQVAVARSAEAPVAQEKAEAPALPPRKSAAAAAGWNGATVTPASSSRLSSTNMSAAWPAEVETETPASANTPMNGDGSHSAARKARSFSDITELPPLKEIHVDPLPPPPPVEAPEPSQPAEPQRTLYEAPEHQEKPKLPSTEVAKQAINAIRKTPPKLFLYSIAGAALIILLVIGTIYSHMRSERAEENGASEPAATAVAPAPSASPSVAVPVENAAPTPTPVEAESPSATSKARISVASKYTKQRKTSKTAPAPVVIPGELTINSTPEGAQVLVDGHHNPNWVTPFDMTGLGPGQHLVSISKLGYAPETRNIEVASGSKSFLVVQLAAVGATALVSSVPNGAEIFVDGKSTGRVTPSQLQFDKPASHTFLVKKQGYLDETSTAALQAGQNFQFAPILRALGNADDIKPVGKFKKMFGGGETAGMGIISVKTAPKGAQIAVNRRILDKASPQEFYLTPGVYIVDITLSGYKNVEREINVEKGGKLAIDETLQPQ